MHNKDRTTSIKFGKTTWHNLALWSIVLYIILSTLFEESKTGMARYASIGILFCIGTCFIKALIDKKIRIDWWIAYLFFFGIALSLSSLYSPTSIAIKNLYLYRYWTTIVLIFLINNVIQNKTDINFVINGFIYAGVLLALYVYVFYGFSSLSSSSMRLSNEIANQNAIGINCAISFILSVVEMTINKRNKLIYVLFMLITFPACMFSGSRKSVLLILISVFTFFTLYTENSQMIKRFLSGGLIILGVIVAIQYVPAFSVINDRFDQLFALAGRGNASLNVGDVNRMYYMRKGFEAFKENPIWGNGFVYSYYLFNAYSHNNYIELLMNNGLIGFLLFYTIHFRILVHGYRIRSRDKTIAAVIIVTMIMILFIDLGSVNYYSRNILIMMCLAAKLCSIVHDSGEVNSYEA